MNTIAQNIRLVRGHKVLLGMDLAELYGVEHRALVDERRIGVGPEVLVHLETRRAEFEAAVMGPPSK